MKIKYLAFLVVALALRAHAEKPVVKTQVEGTVTTSQSGLFTVTPGTASFTILYSTSTRLFNASTATVTSISASINSVTLFSENFSRTGAYIFNDSTSTLYVRYGQNATTNSFTLKITDNAFYEVPISAYNGIMTGVWDAAVGRAMATSLP